LPNIQIGAKGTEKLLNNLNPHKAFGPDKIKPIILNTLFIELSPIINKNSQIMLLSIKNET
jgi:hypothetical protein